MSKGSCVTRWQLLILNIFFLQESVVSMLEQLPGAHQLKQYSFKYNPPFDNGSLGETQVRFGNNTLMIVSYTGNGKSLIDSFVRPNWFVNVP